MTTSAFDFSRSLMCVEYPGIVNNVDNMIDSLGGLTEISNVYCTRNRRLEVRFRPKDIYCKPTCGDKHKTMALIIKIKIKRKRNPKDGEPSVRVISNEVIGRVHTIYRFNTLCDFQYLTIDKDENNEGKLKCVYNDIVPIGMPSAAWLASPAPYFLPPATFSRIDIPQNVSLEKDAKDSRIPANVIGRTRRRRQGHAVFVTFSKMGPEAPKAANKVAFNLLHIKFLGGTHYAALKELFDKRPIWSKNALMHHTGYTREQLKYLLPTVAYYFVTGPWRVMWVRFGYDPRQDFGSRIYQTMDYRLRAYGGLNTLIKAKRNYANYVLPYKSSPSCRPKTVIISKDVKRPGVRKTATKSHITQVAEENVYIFQPGMVPPSRQMFYQYCDLHLPEIQRMLESIPLPDPEIRVDPKIGWMPTGFDEKCREIMHEYINKELKAAAAQKFVKRQKQGEGSSQKVEEETQELEYEDVEQGKEEFEDRNEEWDDSEYV